MGRHLPSVFVCAFLLFSSSISPAAAGWFSGVPILGPVEDAVTDGLKEGGKLVEKGVKELGNAAEDIVEQGEKLVSKAFQEIGNGLEDLRVLVEEGTCGGDICVALGAAVDMVEGTLKDGGQALKDAERRISEGKVLDALWHLSIAPYDIQQENAARAAMKSSIIRAVGQVAASAYGGPYGAAAYSAWLTYHATDGNIELALKAGAMAGLTAEVTSDLAKEVEFVDIIKDFQGDEIIQRAVSSGALAGVAVAVSGGSQADIEQAFVAGAVSSVLRDAYKATTLSDLEDNLKASEGVAYCLGIDPRQIAIEDRPPCAPPDEFFIKANGEYVVENGKVQTDFTQLDYGRPHVGKFTDLPLDPNPTAESSHFMTGVSRIPGMNAMSIAHDIFAGAAERGFPVLDTVISVGTIPAFVVMTYDGAGFTVQEMIRDVTLRQNAALVEGQGPTQATETGEELVLDAPSVIGENPPAATDVPMNFTEIRSMYCVNEAGATKTVLMEIAVVDDPSSDYERICRIDQHLGGDRWAHLWHAHHQKSFCQAKYSDLFVRFLNQGYQCFTNEGLRLTPAAEHLSMN